MTLRPLAVPDALEMTPRQHGDDRGVFLEAYRAAELAEAVGHRVDVAQVNTSVSARGVLRGVHFADVPPGQAKYVTCVSGRVLDVVVDLRVGSPTFGVHDAVVLDDVDRRAVYVPEGLGHAFLSLADDSTVVYLCSEPYAPGREHELDPLDPGMALPWPADVQPRLSAKDAAAPGLDQAREAGALPSSEDCQALDARLREQRPPA